MSKGDIETYFEDGQWKNRPQGNDRASNVHDRKTDAQAAGRDMARDRGVEHIIKKQDGTIGERNTYPRSRDPKDSKG
ncbi:MAG TPA: DUF2188 domain-containing protein [Nocardioides sp.]|nr:DUF2188 domain-containing protein [Nocardioides sp.]